MRTARSARDANQLAQSHGFYWREWFVPPIVFPIFRCMALGGTGRGWLASKTLGGRSLIMQDRKTIAKDSDDECNHDRARYNSVCCKSIG